ncbi:uncharacterized protein LOC120110463 [Phoenix dactylifera]|uniref:Uncharacterized protein LOC120110463 n=1 Tax=Phoenix dactylifera TaxID=42345 RepID=A0A8B9ABY0_PHODC|nr:uncharacterized protein LOC120110463 [Phoenix dactylifera]
MLIFHRANYLERAATFWPMSGCRQQIQYESRYVTHQENIHLVLLSYYYGTIIYVIFINIFAAEWWVHFGGSARNLKRIAIRILFQTVSSSGCERNWSTFAHIYSKQRNRLTQKRLNDLVYVHYNLWLRLKCIQEEGELKYTDSIYGTFTDDDDDPLLGWLVGQQQELELNEPGSPPRPANFTATEARVNPEQWAERNIPRTPRADQPQAQGSQSPHDWYETPSKRADREMLGRQGQHSQTERARKGKQRVPMESVEEETWTNSDEGSSGDGSSSHGGSGGQYGTNETQPKGGLYFTGESQFTDATQDTDHDRPPDKFHEDIIEYRRRAPRGRSGRQDMAADPTAYGYGFYYPQPQPDEYGYGASSFASAIFGWAPTQSEDTSQSQSVSERSDSSYNLACVPSDWVDLPPPDYTYDTDIYESHRHSSRF